MSPAGTPGGRARESFREAACALRPAGTGRGWSGVAAPGSGRALRGAARGSGEAALPAASALFLPGLCPLPCFCGVARPK